MGRPRKDTVINSKIAAIAAKGYEQMAAPLNGDSFEGFVRMGQAKALFLQILEQCNVEQEEVEENV